MMQTTDAATVRHDLERIMAALNEAHDALRTGISIDLSGLDEAVAVLCPAIEALPRDIGRDLRPDLEMLAAAFDALSADCLRVRDGAAPAGKPVATRRRAAAAYARPPGTPQE
jgi:hypothetical protein